MHSQFTKKPPWPKFGSWLEVGNRWINEINCYYIYNIYIIQKYSWFWSTIYEIARFIFSIQSIKIKLIFTYKPAVLFCLIFKRLRLAVF